MLWIALALPPGEHDPQPLGWWALRFTPRVVCLADAVLLEASTSLRLFGGPAALATALLTPDPPTLTPTHWASASRALVALGRLRCGPPVVATTRLSSRSSIRSSSKPSDRAGQTAASALPPACRRLPPRDLPLSVLDAAREHLALLQGLGCNTWGDLHDLPRAGLTKRFGPALLDALDTARGLREESFTWLEWPVVYDQSLALTVEAETAPALLFGARRLLSGLRGWLRLRQHGVLALQLDWVFASRRGLAQPQDGLLLRTAEPLDDLAHLEHLLAERLQQVQLPAPVQALRLRSIETASLRPANASLLPETQAQATQGVALHQLTERLSARLGAAQVQRVRLHADHQPEHMQQWRSALSAVDAADARLPLAPAPSLPAATGLQAWQGLHPTWLLEPPVLLAVQAGQPVHEGPLLLLAGPQRLELGMWDLQAQPRAALRDYYVARSAQAGLLWVFCERLARRSAAPRWYLHGLFA